VTVSPRPGGRVYRGMSPAEREADRRQRLLDAGLEVFGTRGYAASTIEELCSQAGVTARNFYDHFASREDLLRAVYDRIVDEHVRGIVAALETEETRLEGHIRAGIEAAIHPWEADQRKGRIARVEVVGVSRALEDHRLGVIEGYAGLIEADLDHLAELGLIPARDYRLTSLALVGAVNELMVNWLHRAEKPPVGVLVDELVRLYVAAVR
jgi:AcrR family transcriptional regulator